MSTHDIYRNGKYIGNVIINREVTEEEYNEIINSTVLKNYVEPVDLKINEINSYMEQGRSLQQKHNHFKDDCVALLILAVLIILYYMFR